MLVAARHDETVEPLRGERLAQPRQTCRAGQPGEIRGRQPVMIAGRHMRVQLLERLGQGRRRRVGDQPVPAPAHFGRRRQDSGDQRDDAVGIERRSRRPQEMRQAAPIGL